MSKLRESVPKSENIEVNSLSEMLHSDDNIAIERALIAVSTMEYNEIFYQHANVKRLMTLSNQLQNHLSYYALDALRNLINQAYLTFND